MSGCFIMGIKSRSRPLMMIIAAVLIFAAAAVTFQKKFSPVHSAMNGCKILGILNANRAQSDFKLRCAMTKMIISLAPQTFTAFGIDNALTKDPPSLIKSFTNIRIISMIHDDGEKWYTLPWLNKICWVNRVRLPWFIFKPKIVNAGYFGEIYFFKPQLLLQALQYSEWVVWMDMDIMMVHPNVDIQLSRWIDNRFDVIVTDHHRTPVNNGVVLFKRSAWTFDFIAEWLDICRHRPYYATDNGAFMELLLRHMPPGGDNNKTFDHDSCCNTKAPERCRKDGAVFLDCLVSKFKSRMGDISKNISVHRSAPHIKFVNPGAGFNNHVWIPQMVGWKWPKATCYQSLNTTPFVHT